MSKASDDGRTLNLREIDEAPGYLQLVDKADESAVPQEEQPKLAVKFLIPNAAVGSIIGRGGSNISDIQAQSGARIQLSKIGVGWPVSGGELGGASPDRVLLLTGSLDSVLTALHGVLMTLAAEPVAAAAVAARDGGAMTLRLLVYAQLCGTLIGRGGATIRSFKDASGAMFNISPPPGPGDPPERVVRVIGAPDQLLRAVALVLTKLSQNPDYAALANSSLGPSGLAGPGVDAAHSHPPGPEPGSLTAMRALQALGPAPLGGAPGGGVPPAPLPVLLARQTPGADGVAVAVMGVPEDRVGTVIGRGGSVVNHLKASLGVRIHISPRGEHVPGAPGVRRCEVSGPAAAVDFACRLIQQRVDGFPMG